MHKQRMRNYHIKAYQSEIDNWKSCALKSGKSLSVWIRGILDLVVLESLKPEFTDTRMVRGNIDGRLEIAASCQFRVTEWQIQEWTQCADSEGITVGEWCRQCLDWVSESEYYALAS